MPNYSCRHRYHHQYSNGSDGNGDGHTSVILTIIVIITLTIILSSYDTPCAAVAASILQTNAHVDGTVDDGNGANYQSLFYYLKGIRYGVGNDRGSRYINGDGNGNGNDNTGVRDWSAPAAATFTAPSTPESPSPSPPTLGVQVPIDTDRNNKEVILPVELYGSVESRGACLVNNGKDALALPDPCLCKSGICTYYPFADPGKLWLCEAQGSLASKNCTNVIIKK